MANSTSNIDAISVSQASKEVTANAFFDAASQAATYGRRASTSSGLTWGYYGGNVVKADGATAQIANGTLTLTASATSYIVAAKATGVVSAATTTTNWDNATDYWRLYSVVCGASTVTSWSDLRAIGQYTGSGSGGGGSGIVESIVAGSGVSVDNTDPANPVVSATSSGGMTNPMTTAGDLITGGASGAPGRLGVGTDGQVLKVVSGAPVWTTPGAGTGVVETIVAGTGITVDDTDPANPIVNATASAPVTAIPIAVSDESTALTTGTAKVTFRMPFGFTITGVRASVTTAPTGSVLTVDINEGGASILSTKLTIDASEKTSTTAATPAVISDTALADDAEITIDIDTVGSTVAGAGLKVYLIGTVA